MNVKKIVGLLAMALVLTLNFSMVTLAYSDSTEATLPGTSYKIQSNVWQSATAFNQTHSFKVSAKLLDSSNSAVTANTIKTSWSFAATGVGVSVKGVSSGSSSGSTFSGSWTNTSAWISDMSGTFKISGVPLTSTFDNTAFALKSGSKATATASCFRFY